MHKADDEAADHEEEIHTGVAERKYLGRHVTKILRGNEHPGGVIDDNQAGRQTPTHLNANKPIALLMDKSPLIVEAEMHIDALEWLIASEKPGALLQGFILTRDGMYLSVGSAISVLRASLRRTERQKRKL